MLSENQNLKAHALCNMQITVDKMTDSTHYYERHKLWYIKTLNHPHVRTCSSECSIQQQISRDDDPDLEKKHMFLMM
jgi:hypothetical protein